MYAAALIDQHPLLRLGLARILSNLPDIREIRVLDPLTLAAETVSDPTLELRILLFGLSDDEDRDRNLLERAAQSLKPQHVLLLGDDSDAYGPAHPLVAGRIRKSASSAVVEAAVQLVVAGGACFPAPRDLTRSMAGDPVWALHHARRHIESDEDFVLPDTATIASGAYKLRITPRQFEILLLRAHGFSPRVVAQKLGISEATVKSHASAMYRRLSVSNSQEAILEALRLGVDLLFNTPR